jgi:hypothetical protein
MSDERILTAADGMVYTNGETYGKVIYLGVTDDPANWREAPEGEVSTDMDEDATDADEATEADYLAALAKLGVQ